MSEDRVSAPIVEQQDPVGEEGTWIGLIGAAVVALWFLARDVAAGHPLRTPSILGQVLLMGKSSPKVDQLDFAGIILYTAAHVFVFLLFGMAVAHLVRWSVRNHFVRYALLQVFLAFELFFCVVLLVFREETRSLFPLSSVLIANTLAAIAIGIYLWRHHPELRRIAAADAPWRRPAALRSRTHRPFRYFPALRSCEDVCATWSAAFSLSS